MGMSAMYLSGMAIKSKIKKEVPSANPTILKSLISLCIIPDPVGGGYFAFSDGFFSVFNLFNGLLPFNELRIDFAAVCGSSFSETMSARRS